MQITWRQRQRRWLPILFLLLYFAAAVWMALHLPANATPNELLNFEYIQVMRQIRGLPNRGLLDSEVRYSEWHQPPIYFTFAALVGLPLPVPPSDVNPPPPIEWPGNPSYLSTHRGNLNPVVHITPQNTPLLYTSRIAASFLGLLGLAALYRAGRDVVSPTVGLLMLSLLAFQPNYLHLSGSVNNDMPLTAVVAITLAYTIFIIHNNKGPIWFLGLGLLCATAILTKANGVFVLAYVGIDCFIVLLQQRSWWRAIKSGLLALIGLLPLWAAWLILNSIRTKDALGVEGSLPVGRVLALSPGDFALLGPWLDDIWRSIWLDWSTGEVGYGPEWIYILWAVILFFMLLGWLLPPYKARWRSALQSPALIVLLGVLAISYLYIAVKALTVKEAGYLVPEGRWWLPAMAGIAWLAAAGFARWWPIRLRDTAVTIAAFIPTLFTYGLLFIFLPSLYPQAQPLTDVTAVNQQTPFIYNEEVALLSAEWTGGIIGEPSSLELVWQALIGPTVDYRVVTQLLVMDPTGWQKLEEQATYPGYGLNPTLDWQAGDLYRDNLELRPQGTLNGPTLTAVALQLRDDANDPDNNVPVTYDGTIVDPPVVVTAVTRPENPLDPPEPMVAPVSYGDLFTLNQVDLITENDDLLITLWWKAEQTPSEDYIVFVHALDDNDQILTQSDSEPNNGFSPTSIWQTGDVIRDVHRLSGADDAAKVLIGVYQPITGQRLLVIVQGQVLTDSVFHLSIDNNSANQP